MAQGIVSIVLKRSASYAASCLMIGVAAGCTSFATVRSAEVTPGFRANLGVTASSPPGNETAWFWTSDCAEDCDHFIISPHAAFSYGIVPAPTGPAFDIGAGVSGSYPYLEGYVQLARDATPFGLGARIGVPGSSWREDALFARFDKAMGPASRLLFVPTLFRHGGNSPNGQIPASFLAFAPALGFLRSHDGGSFTISLVPVLGRTNREHLNFGVTAPRHVSAVAGFVVLGVAVTVE